MFKILERKGKPTKVPFDPGYASPGATSQGRETSVKTEKLKEQKSKFCVPFCSFAMLEEMDPTHRAHFDGPGFVLGDGYAGVDLDNCFDENGQLKPWARPYVELLKGTYGELSPSGRGLKFCLLGVKPSFAMCKIYLGADGQQVKDPKQAAGSIEVYDHDRFFTLTGWIIPGMGREVVDCQSQLDTLCGWLWTDKPKHTRSGGACLGGGRTASVADSELLDKARRAGKGMGVKFAALFDGGDDMGDHSKADYTLCKSLAYWTDCDAERIDQLFRQSALYRDKWDRDYYRKRTIAKAIDSTTRTYGDVLAEVKEKKAQWKHEARRRQVKPAQPSEQPQDQPPASDPDGRRRRGQHSRLPRRMPSLRKYYQQCNRLRNGLYQNLDCPSALSVVTYACGRRRKCPACDSFKRDSRYEDFEHALECEKPESLHWFQTTDPREWDSFLKNQRDRAKNLEQEVRRFESVYVGADGSRQWMALTPIEGKHTEPVTPDKAREIARSACNIPYRPEGHYKVRCCGAWMQEKPIPKRKRLADAPDNHAIIEAFLKKENISFEIKLSLYGTLYRRLLFWANEDQKQKILARFEAEMSLLREKTRNKDISKDKPFDLGRFDAEFDPPKRLDEGDLDETG
jgi:hypothetical protein